MKPRKSACRTKGRQTDGKATKMAASDESENGVKQFVQTEKSVSEQGAEKENPRQRREALVNGRMRMEKSDRKNTTATHQENEWERGKEENSEEYWMSTETKCIRADEKKHKKNG